MFNRIVKHIRSGIVIVVGVAGAVIVLGVHFGVIP